MNNENDQDTVEPVRRQLESGKAESVGHLLIKTARLFDERASALAAERFAMPLRRSHLAVFAHVDFAGTRLTTIAERMGITKQAVGQLVADLEAMNMLERTPDPSDGRAKLVRFTAEGERRMVDGVGILLEVQGELAERVGEETMTALHHHLTVLLNALSGEEVS